MFIEIPHKIQTNFFRSTKWWNHALIEPRLRALYLAFIAVGVFFLPKLWMVVTVLGLQIVLWFALRLPARQLAWQFRKLVLFLSVIFVAYSLVSNDPDTDRWRTYQIAGLSVNMNLTGALVGLAMVLRVLAVVLASQVARSGDPHALTAGLGKLGVPRIVALSMDSVLTLLGDSARGRGWSRARRGRGMGHGKGGAGRREGDGSAGESAQADFWAGLKRLARGGVIAQLLHNHVDRVEKHINETTEDEKSRRLGHDVAVISGVALTMLGIKAFKLLPGLPFAPGHKGVLFIPLYIVAGRMTQSRAGSTLTGLTMGSVAFLLGDGRWGIFEIAKHMAPGILVDLFMPFMRGRRGKLAPRRSIWGEVFAWSLFGLVVALGRFATVIAIALCVQAPALVYALLVPGLAAHASFGVLSGIVTVPLLRAIEEGPERRSKNNPHGQPDRDKLEAAMIKMVRGEGRLHIKSPLMRESLQDLSVIGRTESDKDLQIFPDVALVSIGGQSIFDRGREAIFPIVEELIAASSKHRMVIGVGGGTRVRHTASVALDLGLPTGGVAQLIGAMEHLNAVLLNALLAQHGSIIMQREHFWELPLYIQSGMIPIAISIPPYHLWEPPPEHGALPSHGSDFGLFQLAEVLAMRQIIFVKDENGLYDKDPKKHNDAKFISTITLDELLANPPQESILDRALFTAWKAAKNVKRVQILNGLERGMLTAALEGEDVGTVIIKDGANG